MGRKQSKPDPADKGTELGGPGAPSGPPSSFVCPECGGALWELRDGKLISFRCHVGHAYTADGMVARHTEKLDAALWTALRTLEDNAALRRHMADNMRERGLEQIADKYDDQAEQLEDRADVIRNVVAQAEPPAPSEETEPRVNDRRPAAAKRNGNGEKRRRR
jgi:two-component system chemotaxis response regulator CheB